ncbi:MAG: hypothetical protein OXI41_14255 [Chloroflexota bacterium]|nr:hypothetical protein [Chloroflexota bacterium]MDE2895757.1 hypothetical protein [Chloroflexota bacterium]
MLRRILRAIQCDFLEMLRSRLLHRASNYVVALVIVVVTNIFNTFISNWLEWSIVIEAGVAIGIAVGVFSLWWYGRRVVRRYAHLLEPEPSPEEARLERIEAKLEELPQRIAEAIRQSGD